MRYAVQLIAPASNIAKRKGKDEINKEDVMEAEKLFADVKRSMKYLKEYEEMLLGG